MAASLPALDPEITQVNPRVDAEPRTICSTIINFLLGTDAKQRRIIERMLLSAVSFLMIMGAAQIGIAQNVFNGQLIIELSFCWMICVGIFFAIVRSGLNRRFVDPTLALPQACIAQALAMLAYGSFGAAHAAALLLLDFIALFGMLHMQEKAIRYSCIYAVVLSGLVINFHAQKDPVHYPASVELIYFIFTVTVLLVTSQLSVQICRMRTRLKSQKSELCQAYEQMCAISTRDELTGLPNRRQLKFLLEQHAERTKRIGQPLYVAILDLDNFKKINDTYGHHIGDQVLKTLADASVGLLRKTDTIGRWGGEEFLLLLPDTGQDLITTGLLRLQHYVTSTPMCTHPSVSITFSAGLTRYRPDETVEQTLMRADHFLYQAKNCGRNRIMQDPLSDYSMSFRFNNTGT